MPIRLLMTIVLLSAGCEPCRSQCYGDLVASCDVDEFPDFSTTREQWLSEMGEVNCDAADFILIAAECPDGTLVLSRPLSVHFFDPETERFIALTTVDDVIDDACGGVGYWPEYIECSDVVITEVICGLGEVELILDMPRCFGPCYGYAGL